MGFITNLHHWLTSLGGATFVEWMFFFWGGYWENPAPFFFTVRRWLRHQRFSGPTWDTWCAGTKRADLTQHERRISYVSWSKVGLNNYSYHICRLSIHLLGILIVLYTNIYIYIFLEIPWPRWWDEHMTGCESNPCPSGIGIEQKITWVPLVPGKTDLRSSMFHFEIKLISLFGRCARTDPLCFDVPSGNLT